MASIRFSAQCVSLTSAKAVFEVYGLLDDSDTVVELFRGNVMMTFNLLARIYFCDAEYEIVGGAASEQAGFEGNEEIIFDDEDESSENEEADEEEKENAEHLILAYILTSIYRVIERFFFICPGGDYAKIRYRVLGLGEFDRIISDSSTVKISTAKINFNDADNEEKTPVDQ